MFRQLYRHTEPQPSHNRSARILSVAMVQGVQAQNLVNFNVFPLSQA